MADLTPRAGLEDVLLTAVVEPAGAQIDGNAVGVCLDSAGLEIALPSGYSFVEVSQFATRLVCPMVADDAAMADVTVAQKIDKDLGPDQVFLNSNPVTVKTIAPTATAVTTSASVVAKG